MNRLAVLLFTLLVMAASSPAKAGTLAQFRTVFGNLEVELYDQEKPVTTRNFKRLVESGAYHDTFFHRVIPGFAAQGGGFLTLTPQGTNDFAPPWTFLDVVTNFGMISNEFNTGPLLSNTNGMIAMAKQGGDPHSATSQWFFNLGNNSVGGSETNLDLQNGGFTVFGRVVRDTGPTNTGGLLGLFNSMRYGLGLINLQTFYGSNDFFVNLFQTLPVTFFFAYVPPWYSDLVYVDVSLLSVQIAETNNARQISWSSVAGRTNLVEFTTVMPPAWQILASTNGNGGRFNVTDGAATNAFRFYRVRVDY